MGRAHKDKTTAHLVGEATDAFAAYLNKQRALPDAETLRYLATTHTYVLYAEFLRDHVVKDEANVPVLPPPDNDQTTVFDQRAPFPPALLWERYTAVFGHDARQANESELTQLLHEHVHALWPGLSFGPREVNGEAVSLFGRTPTSGEGRGFVGIKLADWDSLDASTLPALPPERVRLTTRAKERLTKLADAEAERMRLNPPPLSDTEQKHQAQHAALAAAGQGK